MQYLKQSTAATVLVGPVLDADGAAVTGAVIGDFRLAKNGTVTTMAGNAISHSHNGCYLITLTTGNTDTLDRLSISVGNTAYGMTVFRFTVLTAAQYDALIANGTITPAQIQSGLATAANVAAVETDTADIQSRLPAALVSGRMDASVGAYQTGMAPPTANQNRDATLGALLVDYTSTGTVGYVLNAFFAMIEYVTGWRFTTAALAQAPGGSTSGSGARTVTITVNDGTTVLQNARVRLTNGAETYSVLTNSSGVVVFNVDDNDWVVSITKAGYSYSGTTLTVNGTETATYSMSLISLTASDVDKVTGYWTVLDEEGNEASGVVVTVKARQASRGSAGALHDAATRTATSAANGLIQFTNMIPGWKYSVVANDEYVADFTVPSDAVTSVELGSIVARLT